MQILVSTKLKSAGITIAIHANGGHKHNVSVGNNSANHNHGVTIGNAGTAGASMEFCSQIYRCYYLLKRTPTLIDREVMY